METKNNNKTAAGGPEAPDQIKVKKWLAIRKKAGRKIDPATAEVMWEYGQTLDPYGIDPDLPEECRQVGRNYFSRAPGSDIWVEFGDLPAATRDVLWKKHQASLAFPAGFEDEINSIPESAVVDLQLVHRFFEEGKPWHLLQALNSLDLPDLPGQLGLAIAAALQTHGKIHSEDAENVVELINAGAEFGVRRMTIKLDREHALGLDLTLGKLKVAREFRATVETRGDTECEIQVEYFDHSQMPNEV